jgi:membrane-associated protease RseP (regulator of RpoE activity)
MKPRLIMKSHLIALLTLAAAPALAADAALAAPKIEIDAPSVKGKATIIIEINGKKEIREIEIGDASRITIEQAGKPAAAESARKTWFGVVVDELGPELRAQLPIHDGAGLLVRRISPESPALRAGLRENDVLVKWDDQILTNLAQLTALVSARAEGDTVRITYYRKGAEATIDVQLGSTNSQEDGPVGDFLSHILSGFSGGDVVSSNQIKDVLKSITAPLIIRTEPLLIDPRGNFGGGGGAPGTPDLRNRLTDSGLSDQEAAEVQRKVAEANAAIQKAVSDLSLKKEDIMREVERAMREAQKAIQAVRSAAEAVEKEVTKSSVETVPETKPGR